MASEAPVRVLVVNDGTGTRDSLIRLCARRDDVEVVGEASCGTAAIGAAGPLNPDVVLLSVELPDMSGFELLRAVAAETRPLGILASHCAGHATRAFDEGAFDYLLMPVSAERFDRAITRARLRLHSAPTPPRFLVGERLRRLYPLDPRTIDYIEADGNYVTLRVGNQAYLSRDSIKRLAHQLTALGFIRIERSLLVNATSIAYAEVARHGTFVLTLNSGACLHSSTAYRDTILRVIPLRALSKRYGGAVPQTADESSAKKGGFIRVPAGFIP